MWRRGYGNGKRLSFGIEQSNTRTESASALHNAVPFLLFRAFFDHLTVRGMSCILSVGMSDVGIHTQVENNENKFMPGLVMRESCQVCNTIKASWNMST